MSASQRYVASWFALLALSSVSMTIGNKLLMSSGTPITHQKHLVLLLQNLVAVTVLCSLVVFQIVRVAAVDRRQGLFLLWDSLVLVLQMWTSFEALHHLPVSATTVVRALAVPVIAWCEGLLLGVRLDRAQHVCAWAVVGGAAAYAYEDFATASRPPLAGYLWAGANLLTFASNSVLDRMMMSTSDQTATGLSLLTQAFSLPICWVQGALVSGLSVETASAVLRSLDWPTVLALVLTGACAGALGSCYAQCYKIATATAVTMMGNTNKALSVLMSFAVFGADLSAVQLSGLVTCLGATGAYSLISARQRDERRDEQAPPKAKAA